MATSKAPVIKTDPNNPRTVILDRWPTEKEKTKLFRDQVTKIRKG